MLLLPTWRLKSSKELWTITWDFKFIKTLRLIPLLFIKHGILLDVLIRFDMMNCRTVSTPSDPHIILCDKANDEDHEFEGLYQQAIGCLMYAMVLTRVDITFAVTRCAQYSSKPRLSHWAAVKSVLCSIFVELYLMGLPSLNHHLTFNCLTGYVDADYSNDVDDRKSRTGVVLKLANGPISWCSQKQGCTADSTTEGEFVALAEGAKEAMCRIGLPQSRRTPIHCDNQSTIRLVKNPEFHKRTKHIAQEEILLFS